MADMRLIVAGAGGRMGRTLTRVISETKGAVVVGALEAPTSELLGKDAGVLAGLPANGVKLSADLWAMSGEADGILDFTVPAATIANVAIAAERGIVHVIGTTGLSASDEAVIKSVTNRAVVVKSGNMSLGVNLLAALVKRAAQSLDRSFDIDAAHANGVRCLAAGWGYGSPEEFAQADAIAPSPAEVAALVFPESLMSATA